MAEYIGKVGVGAYSTGDTPPVSLDDTGAVRTAGSVSVTVATPDLTPFLIRNLGGVNQSLVSPGITTLCGWYIMNDDSVTVYIHLYDNDSDGVPPPSQDLLAFGIPAGGAANILAATGPLFGDALSISANHSQLFSDTASIGAGTLTVNLFYRNS